MLKVGDTIKCSNAKEVIEVMTELAKENIETEFLNEKDGQKGLWLEVKKSSGSVWDNYECEGQLNITDFPEVMP
jgi:hypothetical protein